jgi:hypothetical protein
VALVIRTGTALATDLLIQLRAVGQSGKLAGWLAGPDRPRPRP